MKTLHRHLMLATALAAALAIAAPLALTPVQAGSDTSASDPGFVPSTGQINPGFAKKVPTDSPEGRPIPSHEEALAAFLKKESKDNLPSIGDGPKAELPKTDAMRQVTKDAQDTAGGPQTTNAGTDVSRNGSQGSTNNENSGAKAQGADSGGDGTNKTASDTGSQKPAGGTPQAATTGARAGDMSMSKPGPMMQAQTSQQPQPGQMHAPQGQTALGQSASGQPAPASVAHGPIGATLQTMPSKLSERNDVLDRVPIMAMPLPLSQQDRQRIYQAVMADKSQPASGTEALAPASFLSIEQALNETNALPDSLQDMPLLQGLRYVKAKDKVLLISPSTRIVMGEIVAS